MLQSEAIMKMIAQNDRITGSILQSGKSLYIQDRVKTNGCSE